MELLKYLYTFDAKSRSSQMTHFAKVVKRLCEERGAVVTKDASGNLYVTKGSSDTYPCVVAHLDEVHESRGKGFDVVEKNGVLFGFDFYRNEYNGIGADDKNGIWVALKCLEQYDVLKCAFFVDEECGDLGSHAADIKFFDDCRFVLECDRKGNSDMVNSIGGTELFGDEFLQATNPQAYGYAPHIGGLTDVSALKQKGLKVACCNLCCGYYEPHTVHEYTVFDDLLKCLRFVMHIIEDCTDVYRHEYEAPVYSGRFYGGGYSERWSNFWDDCEREYFKKEEPKKEEETEEEKWTDDELYEAISNYLFYVYYDLGEKLDEEEMLIDIAADFEGLTREHFFEIYNQVMIDDYGTVEEFLEGHNEEAS